MSTQPEALSITLNPDSDALEFHINSIQEVALNSRKDSFSIAPPGLAASENLLLGISGMQADISINCTLWNDGSDRANGSYTETVTTVQEQITYLEDEIHAPDFTASWTLNHETGTAFNDDEVFVETVEPTVLSNQERKWKRCRIGLRRGKSVG